jgi:hypothetical protein
MTRALTNLLTIYSLNFILKDILENVPGNVSSVAKRSFTRTLGNVMYVGIVENVHMRVSSVRKDSLSSGR